MEISNNLTYELDVLEGITESMLAGRGLTGTDMTKVTEECRRLKKSFIRSIPGTERTLLEDYFRLHYQVVSGWCEGVYDLRKKVQVTSAEDADLTLEPVFGQKVQVTSAEDADLALEPVFESVLRDLDDLLLFMEVQLSDYVPQPECLTRYRAEKEIDRLKERLTAMRPRASELGVGEALWGAITDSLTLRGVPLDQVAYGKVAYGKRLASRLDVALAGMRDGERADDALVRLLWQHNLNSASFFWYGVERVQQSIADLPLHDQQAHYIGLQAELAAVYRESGMAYNPDTPHIVDQLYRAYGEEIAKLRRLEKINRRLEHRTDPEDVFRSTLTARQLALFTRLLIHTGLILVDHPRRLFDFVCRHFRTVGTDRLSTDSFYKNAHKKLAKDVQRLEEVVGDLGEAVEGLAE